MLHDSMKSMAFREIPINRGTNVDKVSFDEDSGTLKVSFQRVGSPDYLFYRVPIDVANGFSTSGMTAGLYFNAYIKSQYPFEPFG